MPPFRARYVAGAALSVGLIASGCAEKRPSPEEVAAVYDAFVDDDRRVFTDRVLLQEAAVPVTIGMVSPSLDGAPAEISRELSPEVRQALQDLVARSGTPGRLPADLQLSPSQLRLSADSIESILDDVRARDLHRLPDRASAVLLSGVGFSEDRTVAAVYENHVCGSHCGGASVQVLRRHPGGWLAAEVVHAVIY